MLEEICSQGHNNVHIINRTRIYLFLKHNVALEKGKGELTKSSAPTQFEESEHSH